MVVFLVLTVNKVVFYRNRLFIMLMGYCYGDVYDLLAGNILLVI